MKRTSKNTGVNAVRAGLIFSCSLILALLFSGAVFSAAAQEAPEVVSSISSQPESFQAGLKFKKDVKPAAQPFKENLETDSKNEVWVMIQGLAICLGLFFVGVYFYKRLQGPMPASAKRRLKILERLPISSKTSLLLLEASGREILISVGSDRVAVLDEKEGVVLSGGDAGINFAEQVQAEQLRMGGGR